MKKAHDMNKSLQRLVESYTPKISEHEVLNFLKKKGFDTSSQITKNYVQGVVDLLDYDENPSLEAWYKETKMNYPEDLEELPRLDEALSDEAKANNEMIQKILNKKPSQLTAKEKKFLADNDLVRDSGTGGEYSPSIRRNGASPRNSISKGDSFINNRNGNPAASIDKVDQLNLLKKRGERALAHYNARKDPDILEPGYVRRGESALQSFNRDYENDIKNSKKYVQPKT